MVHGAALDLALRVAKECQPKVPGGKQEGKTGGIRFVREGKMRKMRRDVLFLLPSYLSHLVFFLVVFSPHSRLPEGEVVRG